MMDKIEAIELLKQALSEIPNLRGLHYDNEGYELWVSKIENVIKAGLDQVDYKTFASTHPKGGIPIRGAASEDRLHDYYQEEINAHELAIKKIIQKYELLGIEIKPAAAAGLLPKAFIAHGGRSEARDKLCRFLTALDVTPFIIEEEPKEGRSVNQQVEYYSEQADCAIILGTADDKELKDGKLYPRRNIHIEIGRFQEKFPNRIIYLLEEGASFPSNISEKLYTPFTQESMDDAFITVARELKAFGILKAVKP